MTIKQFCRRYGIRILCQYVDENPHNPDWKEANHFKVTLHRRNPRRQMSLYFSQGYGINGEPTVEGVLDCLRSDSFCESDFEGFCSEYGYDTDSRKAERTWKTTLDQTKKLGAFLAGADNMPSSLVELQDCEGE